MQPPHNISRIDKKHALILNAIANLACHIYKDVAIRRTKGDTEQQGNNFDQKGKYRQK